VLSGTAWSGTCLSTSVLLCRGLPSQGHAGRSSPGLCHLPGKARSECWLPWVETWQTTEVQHLGIFSNTNTNLGGQYEYLLFQHLLEYKPNEYLVGVGLDDL